MIATINATPAGRSYSGVQAVQARRYATAPCPLAATPSQVGETITTVAGCGLAKHSPKRFAMAGIDTNVWPLGPQEWTSG